MGRRLVIIDTSFNLGQFVFAKVTVANTDGGKTESEEKSEETSQLFPACRPNLIPGLAEGVGWLRIKDKQNIFLPKQQFRQATEHTF